MTRGSILLGATVGLVLAFIVLAVLGKGGYASPGVTCSPILSDCDGGLRELVIQYVPEAAPIVAPVYREFLGRLSADVTVHVVCPDQAAFDDLRGRLGGVRCRLSAIAAGHPMTAWARDRWLATAAAHRGGPITLFHPRGEQGADTWPARAGDKRIAEDIAAALVGRVVARRSRLYFDGGDVVADDRAAFVTPRVAARNVKHTVRDRRELARALREMLGRRVVLLDEAPMHHAGMYMMPIGGGRILVGDPALAAKAIEEFPIPPEAMPPGPDFGDETRRLYDAVAKRCTREGYQVVRIPIVPGLDGRTYITYLNVIIDERDGRRIVYMPVYRHVGALNTAAASVWRAAGYDVRTVDCTSSYVHFGSLRCLVAVLRR